MNDHWLSAQEQRAWRAFLGLHRELSARLNRQLQADSQLSLTDYEVLVVLSEAPTTAGCARSRCSDFLQWEQSRLSHHITPDAAPRPGLPRGMRRRRARRLRSC